LLRRGNDPVIGVSQVELGLRQLLGEYFARPRFKELVGHPLAVLGLGMRTWPGWLRAVLLTGGVVAQASILNSFSHYHTPLAVSLERTLAALVIGVAIGLVLLIIARLGTRWVGRWLAATPTSAGASASVGASASDHAVAADVAADSAVRSPPPPDSRPVD